MGGLLSKPKVPKPATMPVPDDVEAQRAREEMLRRARQMQGRDDTVLSGYGTKLGQP